MENPKPVEIDAPVLFKRSVKRKRKRHGFTLPDETMSALQEIVDQGEAKSLSEAIDVATRFYLANAKALHVHLDAETRGTLTRHFAGKGLLPAEGLGVVAAAVIASEAKKNGGDSAA